LAGVESFDASYLMIECTMIRTRIIHRKFFGYSGAMFTRVELVERRFPRFLVPVFGPELRGRRWSCRHSKNRTANRVTLPIQNFATKGTPKPKDISTLPRRFGDSGSLASLVHPAILNRLSLHLAPVWEPNFNGRGVFW
jgi:hypothetical protein